MGKETIRDDLVRQRLNLIRAVKKYGISLGCERFGKHRSYYYYWNDRYKRWDWHGLRDRSRRPHRMPKISKEKNVKAVIKMRRKTNYGKERIHEYLKDKGIIIPVSTIGNILRRSGLLVKRRRWKTAKKHIRRYDLLYPGQRIQMDLKYVPYMVKGRYWYQYSVLDEHTRMRYLEWHESRWVKTVVEVLKRAQRYFGFKIEAVQTDNGTEFTYDYTSELTARDKVPIIHPLDRYCKEAGILHVLIPPGEKELNGKVERSHRTDDEEFYRRYKRAKTIQQLRSYGRLWLYEYNFERKHWGVNKMTPAAFCKLRLKNLKGVSKMS